MWLVAIIPLRRLQIDIDSFSFVEKGSQSVSWITEFNSVATGGANLEDTQVLNCPPPAKTSHLVILKQEPSFEEQLQVVGSKLQAKEPLCAEKSRPWSFVKEQEPVLRRTVASSQFQVARINDEVRGWWLRVGKSKISVPSCSVPRRRRRKLLAMLNWRWGRAPRSRHAGGGFKPP